MAMLLDIPVFPLLPTAFSETVVWRGQSFVLQWAHPGCSTAIPTAAATAMAHLALQCKINCRGYGYNNKAPKPISITAAT
eukprot:9603481-Heterocapsa_arctica.AAC.1